MTALSRRVWHWVSLALLGIGLGSARPALAQIPARLPEPELAPSAEVVPPPATPAPLAAPLTPRSEPAAAKPVKVPAKAVVLTEPQPAQAEVVDDDPRSLRTSPRATWYGWQTLAADAATLSVFVTAGIASSRGGSDKVSAPMSVVGVLGYELAPGIVHFAHRHPGRGFASFGIRIGLPLAGALLGASIASGCDGFLCEAGGAAVGALAGVGGAIAIDAAVFAYDDPAPEQRSSLSPLLVVTRDRAMLQLALTL
jgi:hypothetical protein